MKSQIKNAIKIVFLAIILSFGIGYALAWTAPASTPPSGNVDAPVNTSATSQTKQGDLSVSNLGLNNLVLAVGGGITFGDNSVQTKATPAIVKTCPAGQSIKAIATNGAVTCAVSSITCNSSAVLTSACGGGTFGDAKDTTFTCVGGVITNISTGACYQTGGGN